VQGARAFSKLPLQGRSLGLVDAARLFRAALKLCREQWPEEGDTVWKHLLKIYEESWINKGRPETLCAETLIFNEGWLLRSVLKEWKTNFRSSEMRFLPFPKDARVYSEGQLSTPFKPRRRGDPEGETHTHVDGVAGHFSIADGSKSRIELNFDSRYLAVFEAQLYSPIGKGIKNAPKYDQVSRTAACLIHALLGAKPAADCAAHLVVLYPEDNLDIKEDNYSKAHIREQIANRLEAYRHTGEATDELGRFETDWEEMLETIQLRFVTWEEVLAEIGEESLRQFYRLCREFNDPPARP
jgi:hypothetical protein